MLPLVSIGMALANFVPGLIGAFGGKKAEDVAEKVVSIAKVITGKEDPNDALSAIKADPSLAYEFQTEVLKARSAGQLAEWQDEADRRKDIRDSGELSRLVRPYIALSFHTLVVGMALFDMPGLKAFMSIVLVTWGTFDITAGGAYVMILLFYFMTKGMKDYFIGKNPT
jgi:hypothetical protein